MSLLSIRDFYPSDLLSELKLKPWWETLRGYGYVAGVASTLSLLIATFPQVAISCFMVPDNATQSQAFSTIPEAAINSYCIRHVPWYIACNGIAALSVMAFLYFLEIIWTLVPGVTESLTDLSEISGSISGINIPVEEMKTHGVRPITKSSSDKDLKLRDIVMLLIKRFDSVNIMYWYIGRSALLCASLVALSVLNLLAYFEFDFDTNFQCVVQNDFIGNIANATYNFTCIGSTPSVYLLIYSVALAFQGVCMLLGLVLSLNWLRKPRYHNGIWNQDEDMPRQRALKFLCLLLSYRNPELAKNVQEFTEFVLSEAFLHNQRQLTDEAIVANDSEFFRILKISLLKANEEESFAEVVASSAELVFRYAENPERFKVGATKEEKEETDVDFKILTLLLNMFPYYRDTLAEFLRNVVVEMIRHNRVEDEQPENIQQGRVEGDIEMNDRQQPNERIIIAQDELINLSIQWNNRCRWHLLACSPITFSARETGNLRIDLTSLDTYGRSFLYYALRNSSLNKMLTRFQNIFDFLRRTSDLSAQSYVYFDGGRQLVTDFIRDQYEGCNIDGVPEEFLN